MRRTTGRSLLRALAPALVLSIAAGCATPGTATDPAHQIAFDAGCETGRAEGARERYLDPIRDPVIDIDRYADDEAYRQQWDEGFWRCFQRTTGLSAHGARSRPGAGVAYTPDRARFRVDRYIHDALRAR